MPLLTELDTVALGLRCYKHGAPPELGSAAEGAVVEGAFDEAALQAAQEFGFGIGDEGFPILAQPDAFTELRFKLTGILDQHRF